MERKAIRILLVSGSLPPMVCGVGDYTDALARALSAHADVAVAVLTSAEGGRAPSGAYEVYPVVRRWAASELGIVRSVVRSWRPDVIHFQFPTQGYRGNLAWALPILLALGRRRIVQTWHETVPARWGGWRVASGSSWTEKLRTVIPQVLLSAAPGRLIVVRPEFGERMPGWYRLLGIGGRIRLVPNASSIPEVVLSDAERAEVRDRYGAAGRALLAFFGFFHERKGIDDLLAVLDPEHHHLVMVGEANDADPYQRSLLERLRAPPLAAHVTLPGFLPPFEAARVLAAADAVVLPYRDGAGDFNTTLKAAVLQGTFVLTTSTERQGLDEARNVFFAAPRDLTALRAALDRYLGRRTAGPPPDAVGPTWAEIAERHLEIYRDPLTSTPAP